jgi:hypothetical protein
MEIAMPSRHSNEFELIVHPRIAAPTDKEVSNHTIVHPEEIGAS